VYGDFSTMNARWNISKSNTLAERLEKNPEEWAQYHTLYRNARESWTVVPFEEMVKWAEKREGLVIADFGCGEALFGKAVSNRHVVHNFDHVAINEGVIAGDMAETPLDDECLDVAIFSLSLMGANFEEYLNEAYRTLKLDGVLHIWEATSRFDDPKRFARELSKLGFKAFAPEEEGSFIHIEAKKTPRGPVQGAKIGFRA
jgi:SAM-dependent methyltransferase